MRKVQYNKGSILEYKRVQSLELVVWVYVLVLLLDSAGSER